MKIVDLRVRVFSYTAHEKRDQQGHTHAVPPFKGRQSLFTVVTDDGGEGHCFSPVEWVRPFVVENHLRATLIGQDPFRREWIWQTLVDAQRTSGGQLTDKTLSIVDMALWDWAGRKLNVPVYKMIGSFRDKVAAYGSTMCGDEQKGGLSTPQEFADFALKLVKRGYKAIKLHTWNSPISWAPDPKMDIKACTAVREAVGPDIALMIDPYSSYSRLDALWLGRELQKLDFYWLEEPMNEASISSYAWLSQQLDIPILGPETMTGKHHTRAEWVKAGASDILRTGVTDVGGIT